MKVSNSASKNLKGLLWGLYILATANYIKVSEPY